MRITAILLLTNMTIQSSVYAQKAAPEASSVEVKLSFSDIPDLREAFIDPAPTDQKDGIQVGELGIDGGNKAMVLQLAQEIADGKYGNFDSYLITYKGKLIFESYYRRGRVNLPHPQASATKAYTSLALGRAIQLGYLTMADLDKPLISFLKDLELSKLAEGVEHITLHKALTMRSGIRVSNEKREALEKKPRRVKGQRHVQAYLEHTTPITPDSQQFKYQFDPMLVMQVIDAVVPGSAEDFIKHELLDKMGIRNYGWETDVSGLPKSGSRSSMTSRDMIKWGTLVINKGKWNGEQLVPEAFIARATSKIVDQSDEYDDTANGVSGTSYGYFWWQADLSVGDKTYLSKGARGGSGQTIIVIDALDLVIATTTHRDVDDVTAVTATRVLPAFIEGGNPFTNGKTESQNTSQVLEGPYLGQKPPGLTPEVFAPGIVTTEDWGDAGSFSPDMNEFHVGRWRVVNEKLERKYVTFRKTDNRWHQVEMPDGTQKPSFSPDGNTQYFRSKYRERTQTGWSELKSLGLSFEEIRIMSLNASSKGTLVFDEVGTNGNGVLRYSRLIDGQRQEPKPFSKEINTGTWNAHPFIAPDESYIMWDGERGDGYGSSDLYISFRQEDGSWGIAINLGDQINTEAEEGGPRITPDGKYLFFNRMVTPATGGGAPQSDLFWVDARVIENLRPKQ